MGLAVLISLSVGALILGVGAFLAWRILQADEPVVSQPIVANEEQTPPQVKDEAAEWVSYNRTGA